MINWTDVGFSTIWIVGASIIVAALSYHYWISTVKNLSLREQLQQPGFLQPLWVGLILIAVGMAGTSNQTWETIIWIILAALSSVNLWQAIQAPRQS